MGVCLGLGTVKEESSFGLRDVLQILGVVAGALCTFQGGPRPQEKEPEVKKELDVNNRPDT